MAKDWSRYLLISELFREYGARVGVAVDTVGRHVGSAFASVLVLHGIEA